MMIDSEIMASRKKMKGQESETEIDEANGNSIDE